MVQENTKTEVTEVKGSLTYEDKVIQKIVGLALESVNGLLSVDGGFFSNLTGKLVNTDDVTAGVGVEVGKKQVAVDLKVVTEYKKNVPDIYRKIKDVIRKEVSDMTDLEVVEVNVTVVDIKTKEQQKDDEKRINLTKKLTRCQFFCYFQENFTLNRKRLSIIYSTKES